MHSGRRMFLASAAGLVAAATVPLRSRARAASVDVVKPARLRPGDAVALVNHVRIAATPRDFEDAVAVLHRVGLRGRRMSEGDRPLCP